MSPLAPSQQPPSGYMRLLDAAVPPLTDGSYRVTVASQVTKTGLLDEQLDRQRYFNVEGPRFTLGPGLVAGVFPPQGAHGPFSDSLPQIVLNRRTLPWERPLGGHPADPLGSGAGLPWLALLVFDETEATLLTQVDLETVLPKGAIDPMPSGVRCDAVEVSESLLQAVMPVDEEIELLAHVRQVNIEDRELNVSRGDGFFSVVVSNRLAAPNVKSRAYLVSLEGRGDLVGTKPPAVTDLNLGMLAFSNQAISLGSNSPAGGSDVTAVGTVMGHGGPGPAVEAAGPAAIEQVGAISSVIPVLFDPKVRLVCLYSWEFTCEGDANFERLMQGLDVGMLGATNGAQPAVSDSGHVAVDLHDRAGGTSTAWYRGPLVPYPLSRDDEGPYHSADQARRVAPDTGVEDISYSAAFELGRLLAVADGRLAQELMRWRRQGFAASAFADVVSAVSARLPGLDAQLAAQLSAAVAPVAAAVVAGRVAPHLGPIADAAGLETVAGAPGLDPVRLQAAWGLGSTAEARAVLGGTAGVASLGEGVTGPADLAAAVADTVGHARLAAARSQVIASAKVIVEGAP